MATATTTEVETTVLETLREISDVPDAVALDASWEAMDVDSLDLAELAQVVEEAYGVKLEGGDVVHLKTPADAVALVTSRLG